jgi:iron complex transport system ATP-binding protein
VTPSAATPALLALQRVTVLRGERVALDAVTLRIDPGERVCILGPNGCGKSTLVKTLTRECYPVATDDSSMSILGNDRWDVAELRRSLGIVSPDLLAMCTTDVVAADLVLSAFFSSTRIFEHHQLQGGMRARAQAALARLGIEHLAGRAMNTLSSGEAKRVVIARALVHEPRALLFDEPCNALDIGAQAELKGVMRDLARQGLGIVLVTHHVSEIIPEIDRVILMRQGRVVGDGPKRDVLTEARLAELFGVAVRLVELEGYTHVL